MHTWSTYYTWQLQFEVVRGGYDGDIAIDDIVLTDGEIRLKKCFSFIKTSFTNSSS